MTSTIIVLSAQLYREMTIPLPTRHTLEHGCSPGDIPFISFISVLFIKTVAHVSTAVSVVFFLEPPQQLPTSPHGPPDGSKHCFYVTSNVFRAAVNSTSRGLAAEHNGASRE